MALANKFWLHTTWHRIFAQAAVKST